MANIDFVQKIRKYIIFNYLYSCEIYEKLLYF